MFDRWIEDGLLDTLDDEGIGCIVFSPLAQGMLTDRYLEGIPSDSRAGKDGPFLKAEQVTRDKLDVVRQLQGIAQARGQTLAQLALSWVMRRPTVTSALIGASRPQQIIDAAGIASQPPLTAEEAQSIEQVLAG